MLAKLPFVDILRFAIISNSIFLHHFSTYLKMYDARTFLRCHNGLTRSHYILPGHQQSVRPNSQWRTEFSDKIAKEQFAKSQKHVVRDALQISPIPSDSNKATW